MTVYRTESDALLLKSLPIHALAPPLLRRRNRTDQVIDHIFQSPQALLNTGGQIAFVRSSAKLAHQFRFIIFLLKPVQHVDYMSLCQWVGVVPVFCPLHLGDLHHQLPHIKIRDFSFPEYGDKVDQIRFCQRRFCQLSFR